MTQTEFQLPSYPWHQPLISQFSSMQQQRRLAPAILLRERPQCYDEVLVQTLAYLTLCEHSPPCFSCKHCRLIHEGTHPNLVILNAADKVSIDDIRQLEAEVWKTAVFDKPKLIIIRLADYLSINAQNSLLKTLEEPPQNLHFILTVEQAANLLPTLHSRLLRLSHSKISTEQLDNWLSEQGIETHQLRQKAIDYAKLLPATALALAADETKIAQLESEKNQFLAFLLLKLNAHAFAGILDGDDKVANCRKFQGYTEKIIARIMQQHDSNGNDNHWQGISAKQLFSLRDKFSDLIRLEKTNCNWILQAQTQLMDWQNDRQTKN